MPKVPEDQIIEPPTLFNTNQIFPPTITVTASSTGTNATSSPSASAAGGTGGADPTPTRAPVPRKRGGSTQDLSHGRMAVKIYPLSEDQLENIGLQRGISAACFALAGTCFGFGLNVVKDLQINSGTSEAVFARWQAISYISMGCALVLACLGGYFWWRGQNTISKIDARTTFQ